MRTATGWVVLLAFGCSPSAQQPAGGADGSASSSSGGSAGAGASGGSAAQASGGTPSAMGGGGAGVSSGGAMVDSGAAGLGGGGGAKGGSAGASGNGGTNGASGNGGTGGAGGAGACVKNLACKLSPPPSTGDIHQDCVDRINQFLTQCACLPALTRRTDGEACATQMAQYDANQNSAHAGFDAKICQPAGSQNECPGYSSNSQVIGLCMQQMWNEGPPPTGSCTGVCYEDHGHFINMNDPLVTKVACGFFTTASGKVWAVQNFSR